MLVYFESKNKENPKSQLHQKNFPTRCLRWLSIYNCTSKNKALVSTPKAEETKLWYPAYLTVEMHVIVTVALEATISTTGAARVLRLRPLGFEVRIGALSDDVNEEEEKDKPLHMMVFHQRWLLRQLQN